MRKVAIYVGAYVLVGLAVGAVLWMFEGPRADWNPFVTGFAISAGLIVGQIIRRQFVTRRPNPADEF